MKALSLLHITTAAKEWGYSERQFKIILDDMDIPRLEFESKSGRARVFVKRTELQAIPKKTLSHLAENKTTGMSDARAFQCSICGPRMRCIDVSHLEVIGESNRD